MYGRNDQAPPIPPMRVKKYEQQHEISDVEKDDGSEIYVAHNYYQNRSSGAGGERQQPINYYSNSRPPSTLPPRSEIFSVAGSSVKTKNSRGVVVETMSAPNPFCPNARGVCCLLLLINLGLILVTLGFSIVLQLFEPAFVWYCGILFLLVGFTALISSLIFCVSLCRAANKDSSINSDLYWTHHWQKRINF